MGGETWVKVSMAQIIFFLDNSLFLLPLLDTVNTPYMPPMGQVSPSLELPDGASVRHTQKTQALYTISPANLASSFSLKEKGWRGKKKDK